MSTKITGKSEKYGEKELHALNFAPLGSLLGAFWCLWASLARPWGPLGAPLCPSGLPFGCSGAPFLPILTPGASQITAWATFIDFLSLFYRFFLQNFT